MKNSTKLKTTKKVTSKKQLTKSKLKQNDIKTVPIKRKKNDKHYHFIADNMEENYITFPITSKAKKGNNSKNKNYPLKINPIPHINKDVEKSFIRKKAHVEKKTNYYAPNKALVHKEDWNKIKSFSEKAKRNPKNKKK